MKVESFFTRNVVTAGLDTTIYEAARLMRSEHVGDVVVVDENDSDKPMGILTDRDIVVSVLAPDLDTKTITVGDAMSERLATIRLTDDLSDAIAIMGEASVRRLPVVDERKKLVGVLSLDDIVRVLGRYMDKLSRLADTQTFYERTTKR